MSNYEQLSAEQRERCDSCRRQIGPDKRVKTAHCRHSLESRIAPDGACLAYRPREAVVEQPH